MYSVKLSPNHDNTFTLIEEYRYKDVIVPINYKTNGANIPFIFWIFIPPFKPKYLPAVVVHDYLCDLEQYTLADEMFKEMLDKIEESVFTKSMIKSVKIYHKVRYNV